MPPVNPAELDAALRKSAVLWVAPTGHPARLVWGVHAPRGGPPGTLLVACGGGEQEVAGLIDGAEVVVTVARPGTRSALCTLTCTAVELDEPGPVVAAALTSARRNASPTWTRVLAMDLHAALARGAGG